MKTRFDSHHLDPSLKFLRRCRKNGHIIAKSPESFGVVEIPVIGRLIEENSQNLQVIVAHEDLRADVELILVDGDAGLIEDHEEFLEAVVVSQQLRISMDDAQLMVPLLLHLKRQHLCAETEIPFILNCRSLLPELFFPHGSLLIIAGVEADFPLGSFGGVTVFVGAVGEASVDGHLTVLACDPWGESGGVNSAHLVLIL